MTKNAPGHPSFKSQTYRKRNSWSEISQAIDEQYKEGKIITAVSYSKMSKEYIVVKDKDKKHLGM